MRHLITSAFVSAMMGLMLSALAQAQQADPKQLTPWLDVPATWTRTVQDGVVAVSPNDLPPGRSLILLVEPAKKSSEPLTDAYDQALRDLGPWRPAGNPAEQRFDTGWVFRLGVGVATLEGNNYTAQTAVGRRGDLRVRFWALADSDDTFNRYKNAVGIAISSAQDITHPPAKVAATPTAPAVASAKPDPGFGKGVSGVYVGVERGLSASAGVASGPQQVFNQSTGRYETSNTGTATAPSATISDYLEVDVFYPDSIYRRRLPVRGLASDPNWERQQQPILWGTWQRQGNKIVVRRGSYTTTYTIENDHTLVSDRGRPWMKLAPGSGRLDGTYGRADLRRPDAPRITLRADGTYQEHDNFLRMVGSPWHLVQPDADSMVGRVNDAQLARVMSASSGTYSFENFTLTLRTNDGRLWQINAYVPPGEPVPGARQLVINGRALDRK